MSGQETQLLATGQSSSVKWGRAVIKFFSLIKLGETT